MKDDDVGQAVGLEHVDLVEDDIRVDDDKVGLLEPGAGAHGALVEDAAVGGLVLQGEGDGVAVKVEDAAGEVISEVVFAHDL